MQDPWDQKDPKEEAALEAALSPQERLAKASASIASRMPDEYRQAGEPDTFGIPEYAISALGQVLGQPAPIATTMFNRVRINPDWLPKLSGNGLKQALIHEYTHVGQQGKRGFFDNMKPSLTAGDEPGAQAAHRRYKPRTSDIMLPSEKR
jgi:hypothetical protein